MFRPQQRKLLCRTHWVALTLLVACADDPTPTATTARDSAGLNDRTPLPLIVQFAPTVAVDVAAVDLASKFGGTLSARYKKVLHGAALQIPADQIAALQRDPRVVQVDIDGDVWAIGKPLPPIPPPQTNPIGYLYIGATETTNEGDNVIVAVVDTGIDVDHPDLQANFDENQSADCVNENTTFANDLNGHGSHVAGTVAAVDNAFGAVGIGSRIRLASVKVLNRNGKGSWSSVICGLEHVALHADAIRVANLSLGGAGSNCDPTVTPGCTPSALQRAVQNAVGAGVAVVVAAGNEGTDAATQVPAAYPPAITVSAYDVARSSFASWSNYGAVVDLAAPGVGIFSTYKNASYATLSGTSMAAPHVAAAAALYLHAHPGAGPAAVLQGLQVAAWPTYPGQTPLHPEPMLQVRGL